MKYNTNLIEFFMAIFIPQNKLEMIKRYLTPLSLLIFTTLFVSFKGDKDKMHKRSFKVIVTEYRDGKPKPKTTEDEIEFKEGKLNSLFIFDKTGFEKLKYEIKIDSTYIEDEVTKEYLKIEANSTNKEKESIFFTMIIDDYNTEGVVKVTKGGKEKKYFEFLGKEKAIKKK